jgi:PAS domain-containing protein
VARHHQPQTAEAAIAEERRVRETIMESIPGVFYAMDAQGRLTFWNRSFRSKSPSAAPVELTGNAGAGAGRARRPRPPGERISTVFSQGHAVTEA